MTKKYKYIANGLVYGNCWGGGRAAYKTETLTANTKKELLKTASEMLKSGGLDSGMGFESLIGAVLGVEEIETIKKDNRNYNRSEFNIEIIGDLSLKEQDFLIENLKYI